MKGTNLSTRSYYILARFSRSGPTCARDYDYIQFKCYYLLVYMIIKEC